MKLCETQQTPQNVGFRSSTQPTHFYFLGLTEPYWVISEKNIYLADGPMFTATSAEQTVDAIASFLKLD
ncbi:hypothetical protein FM036_45175 [Nostoc sp. HG1]|nr:hypothetical protein [Nostoc sp. HG1]MBC6433407.1 hypothetical protein [Nostoc sp. HG1]MBC6436149.1 hypothetical protein [Nostoc sp. HG1]